MIVNHIDTRDLAKLRGLRSRLHNAGRVPTFDELRDIAETMRLILDRVESAEITEERAIAAEARAEVERLTKELEIARATPAPDPEGLVERLSEIIADFDDDVAAETDMDRGERPDLWTDVDVPIGLIRNLSSALTAMAGELREARARRDEAIAMRVSRVETAAAEIDELTAEVEKWKHEALCLGEFAATYNRDTELQNLMSSNNDLLARVAELTAEVERVREKLLLSDVTLQFVSVALGGPDEWSTHETMISSVRRTAEAAKGEVERLKSGLESAIGARSRWMSEAEKLKAEVERLTRERDTYKASWEQLTVEKAQSSWGEFQRQSRMLKEVENLRDSWKERAEALEAQVKRLLAKDAERIGRALSEESQ